MGKPIINIAQANYTDLADLSLLMGSEAGDVVACPAGGSEVAHQIMNTGTAPMKLLAVSTMLQPEVCHYPDSAKFAVMDRSGSAGFRHVGREVNNLEYWAGE